METNSRMVAIAVTLLALSGCQTIEQHPRVSAFVAASLVLTAGGALRHNGNDADRHFATPSVNCDTGACR